MTTAAMTRSPVGSFFMLIILALFGLLALAAVQSTVTERSHAAAKHGAALATHARNCSEDNNVFQVWASAQRRSLAEICELNPYDMTDPEKTWTVRILNKVTGEEITVFQHTGDIWSLEEYLTRQLYILL